MQRSIDGRSCSGRLATQHSVPRLRIRPCGARTRRAAGLRRLRAADGSGATVDFAKYQGLGNDFILVRIAVATKPAAVTTVAGCVGPGCALGGSQQQPAAAASCCRLLLHMLLSGICIFLAHRSTTGSRRSRLSRRSRQSCCVTATLALAAMGCARTGPVLQPLAGTCRYDLL